MGHIKNCDRRKSTENCDVYLFVSDMFIYEWLIVYECVDVCEYWAELGLLSGEGTWDKQERAEGSYKVLVPTKMMMMMMRRRRRTRITLMTIIIVKMMMIRIIIMKMMTMTDKQKGLLQKSRPQQMLQLFHGTNKISLYIIIIYKKTYQTYFLL